MRFLAGAVFCVALITVTATTHAEDPKKRASELFKQGEVRFGSGDYPGAATAFEEANRLSPHPNIVWNLARSYERSGDPARAANAYQTYLAATSEGVPDRAAAVQSLARLAKQLGRLEIHLIDSATEIFVDGVRVTPPVHYVSPGSHTVRIHPQGREDEEQKVLVEAGSTRSISPSPPAGTPPPPAAVASPPPATMTQDAPPAPSHGLPRAVFFAGAGLTLVATGFAVGFGIDTSNQRSRFDSAPSQATYDSGRSKQLRTNVTIGVAAGLGALTAITGLWLVDWHPGGNTTEVHAGPTSIGFGATF